jgi:hypothetical protein
LMTLWTKSSKWLILVIFSSSWINNTKENIISLKLNTKMNRKVIKYFLILCYSLTSYNPIYTIIRGCLYMDNSFKYCYTSWSTGVIFP